MTQREMIKHAKALLGSKAVSFNGKFSDVRENVQNYVFEEVLNTLVYVMNCRGFSDCRHKACEALHDDPYAKVIVNVATQACFNVHVGFVNVGQYSDFIRDMCSVYVSDSWEKLAD